MSIAVNPNYITGTIDYIPQQIPLAFTDSLATVTTAGYLNANNPYGFNFTKTQFLTAFYNYNGPQDPGTFGIFTISIANSGVITLSEYTSGSGVNALTLPTTVGQIASYGNTLGDITQGQANVSNLFGNISAGQSGTAGAFVANPNTANKGSFIFQAADQVGNTASYLNNAAFGQATVITIPDPGAATANVILNKSAGTQTISSGNFAVSAGTITASGNISSTAGSLISGASGVAGGVTVYPGTASTGTFTFEATAQGGNFASFLTNAAFAQGTTLTLTDPLTASGKIPVFSSSQTPAGSSQIIVSADNTGRLISTGVQFIVATTAAYAGGTTTNTFVAPGLTSSWKVVGVTTDSTNGAAITKCIPGTNTLAITWTGDPGANTTVTYIAYSGAYAP
jgi:hypothetical protein